MTTVQQGTEDLPATQPATQPIVTDPIVLEVIRSYLITTCTEMGIAMMRAAYSPLFSEGRDFSCLILDAGGEMVAQGEFIPAHIGAAVHAAEWAIKEIGGTAMQPGDLYLFNDPYRGGCHIPDVMVLKPCFVDGELVGYAVTVAHMVDVGGMVPGAFGDTRSIFQEGLRLPPVKLYSGDKEVEDIFRILISNVRTPRDTYGDIKAMAGSLYVAERRIAELVAKYGLLTVRQCMHDIKLVSEALARRAISALPAGEWSFAGVIEDDGVTPDQAWTIKATAVIRQDEVIVDYTGSSPQSTGPANQTWGVTASATYAALFNLYGPIPFNHGCYRPVSIIAPPGSFVNVEYPGSCVGGNSDTAPTTIDILLGALSEAAGKGCAADGGTFGLIGTDGVDPRNGRPFTYLHYDRSGWGARYNHDGNDAQSNKNGNGTNTPVEVLETRYPLECVEYSLNTEAAGKPGAGMYRGGFGTRRILRVACPTLTVSAHTNRNIVHPWGKAGGREGGNCRVLFRLKGQQDWKSAVELFGTRSPGKFSGVVLHEGDELMLALPGGGGYGPSARRDPVLVAADVRDGLYTAEEARHQFGVAVDPGTFIVDEAATAALRAAMEG